MLCEHYQDMSSGYPYEQTSQALAQLPNLSICAFSGTLTTLKGFQLLLFLSKHTPNIGLGHGP